MGVIADQVMDEGGRVIGVIPGQLVEKELAHHGITELRVVGSMHERKALMAELADGFIALPGGYGTIVVGRRGLSTVEEFDMGRVSNKLVQAAKDRAVWVVG